jgi:spermidine/putrescine-binding protein
MVSMKRARTHSLSGTSAIATLLALTSAVPASAAGGQLTLLVWEGYADDSFVKPFEEETGCQINAVYVGSNDEIVSKVMSGAGGGGPDLAIERHHQAAGESRRGVADRPVESAELGRFHAAVPKP